MTWIFLNFPTRGVRVKRAYKRDKKRNSDINKILG